MGDMRMNITVPLELYRELKRLSLLHERSVPELIGHPSRFTMATPPSRRVTGSSIDWRDSRRSSATKNVFTNKL